MRKTLAEIFSILFHPVLLCFFLPFLVIYRQTQDGIYALKWQLFSSFFIFLTLGIFFIGKVIGYVSDFDFSNREDRYKFYGIVLPLGCLYLILAYIIKGIFFPLSFITFGILLGTLVFALCNFFTKVSIHTGVACAYVITLWILFGSNTLYISIWIIPFITWARIYLKKHTIKEAILGGFLGCGITMLTFFFAGFFFHP